jgi:hypothetical protein
LILRVISAMTGLGGERRRSVGADLVGRTGDARDGHEGDGAVSGGADDGLVLGGTVMLIFLLHLRLVEVFLVDEATMGRPPCTALAPT